jgi:hypothetical protein
MKDKGNISELLKQSYFWDVDITPGKTISTRLIVERIFTLGTLAEVALLLRYFGKEKVEEVLINLNYIDSKTLNFVSKYFGKSKRKFKCYIRKQSMPQLWNC